jgi:O-antigen/teichoic acid export membrane protein
VSDSGSADESASSHYANHSAAVIRLGLISVLGIAATFGFQIITARMLGPEDFGVLSAFFAIVSMAAIGSSSLQNAVAVQTARALAAGGSGIPPRRLDGFTIEALVLGGGGALIVALGSPLIMQGLNTALFVPLLAAVTVLLSFLFARSVGSIQGSGDSQSAVWWTTISLVLRLALVALAFAFGLGLAGALASVLLASAIAMAGAAFRTRSVPVEHRPFRLVGIVVMVMSIAFAWLTNVDVILVRAHLSESTAGIYSASVMLVKAGFLIPATLSLYLLPRFVRQEGNAGMTRLGVRVTVLTTAGGGVIMTLFFFMAGSLAVRLLFGEAYETSNLFIGGLSLAYLPWIVAQGLLIRMNALASWTASISLAAAAAIQWIGGTLLLPNLTGFIWLLGMLGLAVLGLFVLINRAAARRADAGRAQPLRIP